MKKFLNLIFAAVLALSFAVTANAAELELETVYVKDQGHGEYHQVTADDDYDLTATQTRINFNYYSLPDGTIDDITKRGLMKVGDGVFQIIEMGHDYSIATIKMRMKKYDLPKDVYNGIGNMPGTEDAYTFLTPEGVYYELDGEKLYTTTVTFVEKSNPIDIVMPEEFTQRKFADLEVPAEVVADEYNWKVHLNHNESRTYISKVGEEKSAAVMEYSTVYADNTIDNLSDPEVAIFKYDETPKYYGAMTFAQLNQVAAENSGDTYQSLGWEKIRSYVDYLGDELSEEEVQDAIDLGLGNFIFSSLTDVKHGFDTLISFGIMIGISALILRFILKQEAKNKAKKAKK